VWWTYILFMIPETQHVCRQGLWDRVEWEPCFNTRNNRTKTGMTMYSTAPPFWNIFFSPDSTHQIYIRSAILLIRCCWVLNLALRDNLVIIAAMVHKSTKWRNETKLCLYKYLRMLAKGISLRKSWKQLVNVIIKNWFTLVHWLNIF